MNKKNLFLLILVALPSFYTLKAPHGGRGHHGGGGHHHGGGRWHGGRGFGVGFGVGVTTGLVASYPYRERLYYYDDYDYYNNRSCKKEIRNLERENEQLINDYNSLADDVRKLEQDLNDCTGTGTTTRKRRDYQPSYSITRRGGRGYYCRNTLEQLDRENNKLVSDYNNLAQYAQDLGEELRDCTQKTEK